MRNIKSKNQTNINLSGGHQVSGVCFFAVFITNFKNRHSVTQRKRRISFIMSSSLKLVQADDTMDMTNWNLMERSFVEMKKTFCLLLAFALIISLCACSQQNLEDMTSGTGDGYATIVWGDKTYVPYGALADYGERGKQIGIVDGNKDDRVYELKGYSADEWIVNAFTHDAAMLFREINVTDIPDGWQSEYEWNQ